VNVLLSGVVGSTAYGLAHKDSDVDRLGVFAVDTAELHGLHRPDESHVMKSPDVTMHEAAKWCRLAINCNPTVMELVWLPEDLIEVATPLGEELISLRSSFLSAKRVRNAYLGYATQQFEKLQERGDGTFGPDLTKRTAKHARHMYRLLTQGLMLWRTGRLSIRLANPDIVYSFGTRVAMGDLWHAREVLSSYEHMFDATPTVLPAKPDEHAVETWLRKVRAYYFRPVAREGEK
jgi:predicted nucleotidyltransferase